MKTPPFSRVAMHTTAPRTRVAFVSTYPPRRCGIATFTSDLCTALREVAPDLDVVVCPVDKERLSYGSHAVSALRQDDRDDYAATAAALADAGVDVVVIEHEYGIFGGPDGEWITLFAEELARRAVPYLVTLHTVLSQPSVGQARTLRRLCRGAFAVSVFTETARRLAVAGGVATADRIVVMPHGAPSILLRESQESSCDSWDVRPEIAEVLADAEADGARLLSTFGLVSRGKGLETAIESVAAVAEAHPEVRYVIAGRTHPEIVRHEGEAYRDRLISLVAELGVEQHVSFVDHFLTDAEIALLLGRTEVFLTPYRSREQISSGALTFALAAGCAVVSTDYHYARDMLRGGAGVVVDTSDTTGFAAALRELLAEPERLSSARKAASQLGSSLSWPAVARRFAMVLRSAQGRRTRVVMPRRELELISAHRHG